MSFILKYSSRFEENEFFTKFSVLYSQCDLDKEYFFTAILLFAIRRLLFSISILILGSSPYIQVSINSACSASILLSYIFNNPFKKRKDRYIEIFIETCIFISLSCLAISIFDLINRDVLDWVMVVVLYGSILLPTLVNLFLLVRKLYNKCRNRGKTIQISKKADSSSALPRLFSL